MLRDLHLSDDVWTLILLLLDVSDLRQCRAVCRHFYRLLTSVGTLTLRLELDASGYVEPGNLRQDLTMRQRLAVLREHMSRRRSLIPSRVDTCWDIRANDNPATTPSSEELMFTGDTVARWVNENRGNGRYSGRLDIVSFASPNKGRNISQWSLYEDDLKVDRVWMYPEEDLFVLCQRVTAQASSEEIIHNTGRVFRFYLRTLSSNTPHPNVCQHVLHLRHEYVHETASVDFSGHLMLVRLYAEEKIVLYDWRQGSVLIDRVPFVPRHVEDILLVDDLLLVVYPSRCNLSLLISAMRSRRARYPWTGLGLMEVYSPSLGVKPHWALVAYLELPEVGHTNSLEGPGSEPLASAQRIPLEVMAKLRFQKENAITSSLKSSTPISCVFEVPNSARVIPLSVRFVSSSRDPGMGGSNCYSLLIPYNNILRVVSESRSSSMPTSTYLNPIPWSKWGPGTRWIHCGEVRGEGRWREALVTGPRGVLTNWHICEVRECTCPGDTQSPCTISVIELNPRSHAYKQPFTEEPGDVKKVDSWMRGPLPSLTVSKFGEIDDCLEFRDRSTMHATYIVSEFKHEMLTGIFPDEPPTIWATDEHIIIIKWADGVIPCIKSLTVFTF